MGPHVDPKNDVLIVPLGVFQLCSPQVFHPHEIAGAFFAVLNPALPEQKPAELALGGRLRSNVKTVAHIPSDTVKVPPPRLQVPEDVLTRKGSIGRVLLRKAYLHRFDPKRVVNGLAAFLKGSVHQRYSC